MTQGAALKAMFELAMPNIIAPQRGTRRFRRYMDDVLNLTDSKKLDEYLTNHIKNSEELTGDTAELLLGVKKFKTEIIKLIVRDEDAQLGVIFELKDEEDKIKSDFKKIKQELKKENKEHVHKLNQLDKKGLDTIDDKTYQVFLQRLNEDILTIEKLFQQALSELEKRELLISRDRSQLRSFVFKTDSTIKHDLNFIPFKIADEDKLRNKTFDEMRKFASLTEKNEKIFEKDLKQLLVIIKDSMGLILEEMIDLIELILRMIQSLDKVYDDHIKNKLVDKMYLPNKIEIKIKSEFDEIFKHIKSQAEVNFEKIKIVISDAQKLKDIANTN